MDLMDTDTPKTFHGPQIFISLCIRCTLFSSADKVNNLDPYRYYILERGSGIFCDIESYHQEGIQSADTGEILAPS